MLEYKDILSPFATIVTGLFERNSIYKSVACPPDGGW
jgi:hypothetical protein